MKHLKLMPLLIAAAFSVPRAHAVELVAVGRPGGLVLVGQAYNKFFVSGVKDAGLARIGATDKAQAPPPVPAAPGYRMLLAGMGLICLVGRRQRNEVFRNPV